MHPRGQQLARPRVEPPMHKKPHLPEKICETCQRPFAWRKKWARDWDAVRYCSERCRRSKPAAAKAE